jgi:hypothetical protein
MARRYWVVSPNVDGKGKKVEEWKKAILHTRAALMGWAPDDGRKRIGQKFANNVQTYDIVLIARRHKGKPELVGIGVVIGKCKERRFRFADIPVYVRKLKPFIPLENEPEGIPLLDVLPRDRAMVQLHPDDKDKHAHKEVCEWLDRQLGLTDRQRVSITEKALSKSKTKTYDYKVRIKKQVTEARKREEDLLDDYHRWLKKQGRQLSRLRFGQFECDAWEGEKQNLIEAKGSINREDIRMAVGQLFDYTFQMREKFEKPNKAILLPEEPLWDDVKWLETLDIKVIWRKGESFVDNAGGQFI